MSKKKCKILPKRCKLLPPAPKPHSEYEKLIAIALRRELVDTRKTAKILMRWTGAGGRTVRNWLSGVRGPSGSHLVALMGNSDEVFHTVLAMAKRIPHTGSKELGNARMHALELLRFFEIGVSNSSSVFSQASDEMKKRAGDMEPISTDKLSTN